MRICWMVFLAAIVVSSSAGADTKVKPVAWSMLIDPDAQSFDDPFKRLSPDQLSKLAAVARDRERLKASGLMEEHRARAKERLASAEAALNADGIDTEGILALRWAIAKQRWRALRVRNGKLDGASVRIIGLLISIGADETGTHVAYLGPESGMRNDAPPPAPNQLIRVRMTADWKLARSYEPVRLSGTLSLAPSAKSERIIDGSFPLNATYRLNPSYVETVKARPLAAWGHKRLRTAAE